MGLFKVEFFSPSLGDKLATLYSMENCGRQTGEKFEISGHPVCKQVCDLFHLEHVQYAESGGTRSTRVRVEPIKDVLYTPYVYRIMKFLELHHGYVPEKASPLIPKINHMRGNYIVGQFDSRFAAKEGFLLRYTEINRIIKNRIKPKETMYLIGGRDTQHYINNYEYKLGDLDYLLELTFNAKKFVGVDSGISHMAGVVGTPIEICFLMPKNYRFDQPGDLDKEINPGPPEYYARSYKNLTIFPRG